MATAIVKMTFAIPADGTMTLVEPEPLRVADEHEAGRPTGSLVGAKETAPLLSRVDVLLTGHAHAPEGATQSTVRLMIAGDSGTVLDKALTVTGDLDKSGVAKPIGKLKLGYERTFGGIGFADNPLGTGFGAGNSRPPNISYPSDPEGRTASFGAIPASFPLRKKLLGDTPRSGLVGPVLAIPPGFDWSYFQAAPADQRIDGLRGNEWLVLDGVHPSAERLRAQLPGVTAVTKIYGHDQAGAPDTVPLRIDMLHIDADERRCSLVWRGSFPVTSVAHLRALVVAGGLETPDEPMLWPEAVVDLADVVEPAEPLVSDSVGEPSGDDTISIEEGEGAPGADELFGGTVALEADGLAAQTLPFADRAGSPSPPQARTQPEDPTVLPFKSTGEAPGSDVERPASDALAKVRPAPAQPDNPFEGTVAIDASRLPDAEASPFAITPAGNAAAARGQGAGIPGAPWAAPGATPGGSAPAVPAPVEVAAPPPVEPALVAQESQVASVDAEAERAAELEAQQEVERQAMLEAERQAKAEREKQAKLEAEQQARVEAERQAAAAAEERRRAAADSFRKEQEEARQERERRVAEQAKAKREAAKTLRQDMYGSFKRKK